MTGSGSYSDLFLHKLSHVELWWKHYNNDSYSTNTKITYKAPWSAHVLCTYVHPKNWLQNQFQILVMAIKGKEHGLLNIFTNLLLFLVSDWSKSYIKNFKILNMIIKYMDKLLTKKTMHLDYNLMVNGRISFTEHINSLVTKTENFGVCY